MIMTPDVRKPLLTVHIAASVGWFGAVLAYIPLDALTATSADAATLRAAYVAMDVVARWVIAPLAMAAFATGLAIGLATPWGLLRHYWVVLSLALTGLALLVLLVELTTIARLAELATDPATADAQLRALPSTLPHSIGGAVLLAFVLALNVHKPQGLTRYGWRKQR